MKEVPESGSIVFFEEDYRWRFFVEHPLFLRNYATGIMKQAVTNSGAPFPAAEVVVEKSSS